MCKGVCLLTREDWRHGHIYSRFDVLYLCLIREARLTLMERITYKQGNEVVPGHTAAIITVSTVVVDQQVDD